MVSGVYIVYWPESEVEYPHPEVLIHRQYHADVLDPLHLMSRFEHVYTGHPFTYDPVYDCHFIQHRHDDLIFVLTTSNACENAMSLVVVLSHFKQILQRYLGPQSLMRDTIIDNFDLVYELFDECLDFGIVQITDYNLLKEYIKVEVNLPKLKSPTDKISVSDDDSSDDDESNDKRSKSSKSKHKHKQIKSTHNLAVKDDVLNEEHRIINSAILKTTAGAINWRPKGVFYPKNEIYVDIVEDCEFLYDLESDRIKRNDIEGKCHCRCYLSGMPVCRLGFNEEHVSGIEKGELSQKDNLIKNDDDEEEEEEEEEKLLSPEPSDPPDAKTKQKKKVPLRNVQFHQCTELATIYNEDLVSFVPPDDKFVLMTYHIEQQKQAHKLPLFMINPTYRVVAEGQRLQIMCVLTSNYRRRIHCRDLVIKIPVSPFIFDIDADQISAHQLKYKAEMGEVGYKLDTSEIIWKFDNLTGRKTIRMMAEIPLKSVEGLNGDKVERLLFKRGEQVETDDDGLDRFYGVNGTSASAAKDLLVQSRAKTDHCHITMTFSLHMMTYSGLKITYLTVNEEEMGYTCFPWVRYVTQAKQHQHSNADHHQDSDFRFRLGPSNFQFAPTT
ncbi:hypothetical protein DIURU_000900 [Diutina rugosa]|uniref:MHD domain-containing protein n=1 Tax=Diutina rugosa TaxID=5481 RepID=A0A642UW84_DIURU|nr:uncharacterized protein DIURU_000900 [Diutina rugosa]KAA8906739.1 hypothetical protein DIURU_000900 [Diutina rugosa]